MKKCPECLEKVDRLYPSDVHGRSVCYECLECEGEEFSMRDQEEFESMRSSEIFEIE